MSDPAPAALGAALLGKNEEGRIGVLVGCFRPQVAEADRSLALDELARLARGRAGLAALNAGQRTWHLVVTPLDGASTRQLGVVLDLAGAAVEPFTALSQLLAALIEQLPGAREVEQQEQLARRAAAVVELLAEAMREPDLARASYALANRMAAATGCRQAALGRIREGRARLLALSGKPEFSRRAPLVRAYELAMEEAAREGPLEVPAPAGEREVKIDLAHRELLSATGLGEVMSLPLGKSGAWTFLWDRERPPGPRERDLVHAAAEPVGALLEVLSQRRRWSAGPAQGTGRRWARRLAFLALAAGLVAGARLSVPYPVLARVRLEAHERRAIAAPFEGVLLETHCVPGDRVRRGQVVARLDGRELVSELAELEARRARERKKMELALAEEKIGEAQMAREERRKTEARLAIVRYRLSNLEVVAPLDGVILSGDLKRLHGVPVKMGEVLFEMAPLLRLRAEIAIPAREVSFVRAGSRGALRLDADPEEEYSVEISRVQPVSETRDQENVFIGLAALANPAGRLRPGMEGHARIVAGQKPLWWVLLGRPIEWLWLQAWKI